MITQDILDRLWPQGDHKIPGLRAGIVNAAPRVFVKYGIKNDLVIAHMMAQFSHECGAGLEMTENVNYTAERAAQVWPLRANDVNAHRHFANADDCYKKCSSFPGDPLFHKKLIDLVYGTRMGNRPGTDDGWNFIGRGLPQTTGRDGYTKLQQTTGLPLLDNPNMVSDPANALECGVSDFINCGCLPWAENDNVLEVTEHLNGGTVGLEEREQWLAKWKAVLKGSPAVPQSMLEPVQPKPVTLVKPTIKKHDAAAVGVVTVGAAAATTAKSYGGDPITIGVFLFAIIAIAIGVRAFIKRGKGE